MKNGEVEEPLVSSGYLAYFKVCQFANLFAQTFANIFCFVVGFGSDDDFNG